MRLVARMVLCAWLLAVPAAAQEPRWEIEGYGGLVAAQAASGGTHSLPPAGPSIVTSSPIFPSRAVPSWLFGDGASLLNAVNAEFGLAGRIVPLDAALVRPGVPHAGSFGVRVRRNTSPHWAMEFGVDTTSNLAEADEALGAAVESTRSSFESAFADLLASGPFASVLVRANGSTAAGSLRETTLTFALNRRFGPWGAFAPYATLGGGAAIGSGTGSSVALAAQYRFTVLGAVPIGEDDTVAVRYRSGTAFVAVAGGGVEHGFSGRWGLRIDARVLIGPDPARVEVDASPTFVRASGAASGFVESFTNPAIQFSNDPATGRVSSLSGAPLSGFEVFNGGTRARTQITVGVTRRF